MKIQWKPAPGFDMRYRMLKLAVLVSGIAGGLVTLMLLGLFDGWRLIDFGASQPATPGSPTTVWITIFRFRFITQTERPIQDVAHLLTVLTILLAAGYAALGTMLGSAVPLFLLRRLRRRAKQSHPPLTG